MSKIDYEIRNDGKSHMFCADSELELLDVDILLDDYPYIFKSMLKEEYSLKNYWCFVFDEIVFENKVVGFATYDIRNNYELIMTECYILPEFRGKRLFFDEICKMHFASPKFGILQPTRKVIELLLRYAFAKKANEGIVVSAIDLYLDSLGLKSNKRNGMINLLLPPSNFYDLSICSTLFIHGDEVFYHNLLEEDGLCGHKRKKLNKSYFSNILELFSKNQDKFEDMVVEVKKELPDNKLGYDIIVGYGKGLSDYMQGMVDQDILSYDHAMMIREQLIKEYETGNIDDSNIEDRFNMLSLSEYHVIKDFNDLKNLVNSDEIGVHDELGFFKGLVDIVGDNNQLGNDLFNALMQGNEVEFSDILLNQVESDEDFADNYLDFLTEDFDPEIYKENRERFVKENMEKRYRLDDAESDNDYSVNYEKEMYLVLDALNNGDAYCEALSFLEFESLVSPEFLTGLLLDSEFIENDGIAEIDWINNPPKLQNPELRNILALNDLDFEGTRQELLHRLAENHVNLGENYKITPQGKNFLKENLVIGFYWEFLDEFNFEDYIRYLKNHEGNLKEVSINYLDEHIKLARESNDEDYLEECSYGKEDILEFSDDFFNDLNTLE